MDNGESMPALSWFYAHSSNQIKQNFDSPLTVLTNRHVWFGKSPAGVEQRAVVFGTVALPSTPSTTKQPFGCQSLATAQLRHSWGQPTARVCLCCSKGRLKTRSMAKPYIRAPLPMLWSYKSRHLRQIDKNTHTQEPKKA